MRFADVFLPKFGRFCVFCFKFIKRFQFIKTFYLAEWWNDKLKCHVSLVNVQVERPMFGSGFISSSKPSENDSSEHPNTSLVKKTTPAALPSISGTLASNETKSWEKSAWGNEQIFKRVKTTARSHLTVNSEAPVSQPNRTYFSDTNNKQTSQSTRCDTDANTSYSRPNFAIRSALPSITSAANSRDNWSVPHSSNPFSFTNPTTDYNRSISRKTSTQYGVTHEDVFGDPHDEVRQLIANTKIVTPRTRQPRVQQITERTRNLSLNESSPSQDEVGGWTDLAKLCCCCCCFFE